MLVLICFLGPLIRSQPGLATCLMPEGPRGADREAEGPRGADREADRGSGRGADGGAEGPRGADI